MGIDSESDRAASLVVGPTSLGMVRIFIESDGLELPMDFEPGEALEIASELKAAAERAQALAQASNGTSKKSNHKKGGGGSG